MRGGTTRALFPAFSRRSGGANQGFEEFAQTGWSDKTFACLRLLLVLLLFTVSLTSCGYQLANKKLDAGKGLTIGVPTFSNHTTTYRIEQQISEAVRQELIRRTRFSVEATDKGDLVVAGDVKALTLSPVIFDPSGRGSSYLVIVDLRVSVTDTRTKKVVYTNDNWTFREVFELAENSAEYVPEDVAAVDRLSQRFAAALVDTLLHAK